MIRVSIDPELARERFGLPGEIAARAASKAMGDVLERGAPDTRQKQIGDVVLGAVIVGAIGALAWWNHAESKRGRRAR